MCDHGIIFDSGCTQSPTPSRSSRALSPPLAFVPHPNRYHESDFQAALANLTSVHTRILADLQREVRTGAAAQDTCEIVGCHARDLDKPAAIATGQKFIELDQAHASAATCTSIVASEDVAVAASKAEATTKIKAEATVQDDGTGVSSSMVRSKTNAPLPRKSRPIRKTFTCHDADQNNRNANKYDDITHEADDEVHGEAEDVLEGIVTAPKTSAKFRTTNMLLDVVPAIVILMNTVTLGLSVDVAPGSDLWLGMEYFFMACYTTEAVLKMILFGCRNYFCGPDRKWNWFDMTCIALSYIEAFFQLVLRDVEMDAAAVGLMKILRLARLGRLIRALKFPMFDELKAMIFGVVSGLRVLLWAILLLVLVVYILGIIGNTLLGESCVEFGSVLTATLTMFRCVTDGCVAEDGTPLHHNLLQEYGIAFMAIYILIFMFITVGLFNLIMAIFVDNVVSGSLKRSLEEIGSSHAEIKERMIQEFAGRMRVPRSTVTDSEGNITDSISITRDHFTHWMHEDDIRTLLADAQIETSTTCELFDVLDVDMGGELCLNELINGLMRMRGPVTKADTVAMRLQVQFITGLIEDIETKVTKLIKAI